MNSCVSISAHNGTRTSNFIVVFWNRFGIILKTKMVSASRKYITTHLYFTLISLTEIDHKLFWKDLNNIKLKSTHDLTLLSTSFEFVYNEVESDTHILPNTFFPCVFLYIVAVVFLGTLMVTV